MKYDNIEELVRSIVPFNHGSSSQGWHKTYCSVCGDGHRTKGPRGNWLFNNAMMFYNCYNCGIDGTFNPNREYPFSRDMYAIFKAYNIPLRDCYLLVPPPTGKTVKTVTVPKKINFDPIVLPECFYLLADASPTDAVANRARTHLIQQRRINPDEYPFYLCTGHSKSNNPAEISLAKSYANRLIIPAYVNDKLIGYEGMALGEQGKKYLTTGKNLIHGYNNIFNREEHTPIFITEGFYDAYHFNGVATTTNKLSSTQIEILNRSPRQKIIIPDRKNTHNALAEKGIELNWGISLPEIKPYTDVSKAISEYGILFVVNSAMSNVRYGKIAKISLKLYNI